MKSFKDICKMSQSKLKEYLQNYLTSDAGYDNLVNKDGFLYAQGTTSVMLVAHMDTVHAKKCTNIVVTKDGHISSPQGIGGDDRCGIFMIMNIIKEIKCHVLFCEDEEIGCVGAHKFTDWLKKENVKIDVNYIIELDRKGSNDAVFYQCNNGEFTKFITDGTGLKVAYGSFTDICVVAPAIGVAAVNISCGYYNAHTLSEYVVYDEMMANIKTVTDIIKKNGFKYNYVKAEFIPDIHYNRPSSHYAWGAPSSQLSFKDYEPNPIDDAKRTDLELEVIFTDPDLTEEDSFFAHGDTKAECWMDFFISNPNICFNDVLEYNWN